MSAINSYTITISSDGGDAQTVVRVDDSTGTPRVTEIVVKAGEGASLSAHQLQSIDVELLLRALSPPAGRVTGPAARPDTSGPADVPEPAPVPSHRRTTAKRSTRRQTAAAAAPSQSIGTRVATPRAYRRIPDDLAETYVSVGTVTGVASHYGVPRHTAQGWIGRLRKQE